MTWLHFSTLIRMMSIQREGIFAYSIRNDPLNNLNLESITNDDDMQQVLRQAGVVYSHQHSQIIGESEAEKRLSARATQELQYQLQEEERERQRREQRERERAESQWRFQQLRDNEQQQQLQAILARQRLQATQFSNFSMATNPVSRPTAASTVTMFRNIHLGT
jgi:hypothetical protein